MKKYKLIKLSDDMFDGNHPNFVYAGRYEEGHINSHPKVGERFHFGTGLDHPRNHLLTSTVTEILENGKFKTINSTYQLLEI